MDLVRYSFTETPYFPVLIDISARALFTLVFTVGTMYLHKRTMPKRMEELLDTKRVPVMEIILSLPRKGD
jgi:hypothetical protein